MQQEALVRKLGADSECLPYSAWRCKKVVAIGQSNLVPQERTEVVCEKETEPPF